MSEPNQQSDTPRTDKTEAAYLVGEIGAQDVLHDMGDLEREVDKYQKIAIERGTQLIDANALISALTAQLAEARRDAERYRYVRTLNVPQFKEMFVNNLQTYQPFDSLVDAAIQESKK